MHYLTHVISVIQEASTLGSTTLANGTRLIGQVPHVGSQAWLQEVYAPVSDREIDEIEQAIGASIPQVVRDFLNLANGLNLFSDSLALY